MMPTFRRVLPAVFLLAWAVPAQAADGKISWVRLDLIENSAEGPAFDRCVVEAVQPSPITHWRIFFGEARAGSDSGWAAIRSQSGCAAAASGRAVASWTLRGVPYLMADVRVQQAAVSRREIRIDVALALQKLTGFSGGVPAFETKTQKRTLRITDGGIAAVPILIASARELDQFRVKELVLEFRAGASGSRPAMEYGEIAVSSDFPRAEIFLDGGLVARTSADGPVVLGAVQIGRREVAVRDASGREARAWLQVEKGRRTLVSINLLKDAPASADGLRPLGRNPQGGEEFWRERDGAIVVRIPHGEFQMGSEEGQGELAEHPQHTVRLESFLMDKTEVTWGQYRRFAAETGRRLPKTPIWGTPESFPASNVTWIEAAAFCAWAGGRLPTEAEWERAARGGDSRVYPWGDNWDPWRCNTRDGGPHAPSAAGSNPDCISPNGILDLAGSVWEWCSDWYDAGYYARSPVDNPAGPETGRSRVSRGGGWMSPSFSARGASRAAIDPGWPEAMHGFRCVQDDPKGAGR